LVPQPSFSLDEVSSGLPTQPKSDRLPASNRALFSAVENASAEEIRALLQSGDADPNARDQDGLTPLHFAAFYGNEGATLALIEDPRTDCRAKSNLGATPLEGAAMGGYTETLRLLLEKGGVSAIGVSGERRAIHVAAARGHVKACEILL
jgi:cytohesin